MTLLWETLAEHSCRHSCGKSCRTPLWDTFVRHSCAWDTLVCHSCGTLSQDTLVGHSCGTLLSLLSDTLVALQVCKASDSCKISNSRVNPPKRAFPARLPQKLTRQVCKTSASHKASSKFTRQSSKMSASFPDFLKNSRFKSAKRAFRTRLQKSRVQSQGTLASGSPALPSSFVLPAPRNKARSHANPNVTATFTSTTTRNLINPSTFHEFFCSRDTQCSRIHVQESCTPKLIAFFSLPSGFE